MQMRRSGPGCFQQQNELYKVNCRHVWALGGSFPEHQARQTDHDSTFYYLLNKLRICHFCVKAVTASHSSKHTNGVLQCTVWCRDVNSFLFFLYNKLIFLNILLTKNKLKLSLFVDLWLIPLTYGETARMYCWARSGLAMNQPRVGLRQSAQTIRQ